MPSAQDASLSSPSDRPDAPSVSAARADWSREACPAWSWQPGRQLIGSLRAYQHWSASGSPLAGLLRRWAALRHRFWSVVTGADIPLNSRIGGGLMIPHPNGIVVHPDAEIGVNCLLFQQVTIGAAAGGIPRLGGHVEIGAGARVLGPISVGDHARIGANAVVLIDVPDEGLAVGIPARIVSRARSDPS